MNNNEVQMSNVIVGNFKRRGDGNNCPHRTVTTVHNHDGQLIAEMDPFGQLTIEDLREFAIFSVKNSHYDTKEMVDQFLKLRNPASQ